MAEVKVLITGVSGFTGRHLYAYLLTIPGLKLYGLSRHITPELEKLLPEASLVQGDILDYDGLRNVIEKIKPKYVFHMAGRRSMSDLWSEKWDCLVINSNGTMALLETLKSTDCSAKVLIPSSSAVYGAVDQRRIPIKEDEPLSPIDIYGVSKATQEIIGRQYHASHGIEVMIARVFNCIGPGQGTEFVTSSFACQLIQAKNGDKESEIEVGNLQSVRDYVDVRDVVKAYWLIMDKGTPGQVYNVCTGEGSSVKEILDILIKKAGINVQVVEKAERVRTVDITVSVGSYDKLHRETGWSPITRIEDTSADLLEFWAQQLKCG